MKISTSIPLVSLAASGSASTQPQHIFSNPSSSTSASSGHRIPTSYESAVLGRRILALTPLGNLATVFPSSGNENEHFSAQENRPSGLGGMPHSLMEYVADCEDEGNPTFLAINIETTFRNVKDGSNISLAQQWTPPYPPDKRIKSTTSSSSNNSLVSRFLNWLGLSSKEEEGEEEEARDPVPYSAANLPRFSLLGYIEKIPAEDTVTKAKLSTCFVDKHPDARFWLPGNRIHESEFVRLVVQHVYWVGGFGDRAYIGWIPVDEWRNVTRAEWEDVSLPGEKKGWKEWSLETTMADDL